MATHFYRKLILEQYLDTYGHLNNASYLTILEEARWDWISQKGWGLERIQKDRIGPVVLEVNIRFIREIRLREWVLIESSLGQWQGKIGTIKQKIILESSNQLVTEALLKFGLFHLDQRKLLAPTEEWLRVFG